ncbi:hypothetical protein [Massilia sp. YIM B02443]|uniref:hypothetical protein n=1 Tax=Massilia sp. YIM B02443 TaxID=3050127 RepID=UPI0025B71D5F|nr:hypothetical protein [Massilia sp. YIM B02443]
MTTSTTHPQENIMNILKHMEAAFLVAALVAVPASYLGGGIPDAQADVNAAVKGQAYADAVATSGKTAVVIVSAKRLDAEEKREILLAAR